MRYVTIVDVRRLKVNRVTIYEIVNTAFSLVLFLPNLIV